LKKEAKQKSKYAKTNGHQPFSIFVEQSGNGVRSYGKS